MRYSVILAFLPLALCQSYGNTTSSSSTEVQTTTTITVTSITTLTACPAVTRCHGQTLTITGTIAIAGIACEPTKTCTCVLPPAPPTLTVCPAETVCSGQVVTWSGNAGPSVCASTCTVEFPGGSSATTAPGNGSTLSNTPTPTASPKSGAEGAVKRLWGGWVMIAQVFVAAGAAGLI